MPHLIGPLDTLSDRSTPYRTLLHLIGSCRTLLHHNTPHHAAPCRTTTQRTLPCWTLLHHDSASCLATPFRTLLHRNTAHLALPHLTTAEHSTPCRTARTATAPHCQCHALAVHGTASAPHCHCTTLPPHHTASATHCHCIALQARIQVHKVTAARVPDSGTDLTHFWISLHTRLKDFTSGEWTYFQLWCVCIYYRRESGHVRNWLLGMCHVPWDLNILPRSRRMLAVDAKAPCRSEGT